MFNLEDLKVARKNLAEKRNGSADVAYNEGLKILEIYRKSPSVTRLDEASKKFIEAMEYNSEHLPSLIYLSYVLYALENEEMALKYIKIATQKTEMLPPEIIHYKEQIEKRLGLRNR
jgi:hypothetical protein